MRLTGVLLQAHCCHCDPMSRLYPASTPSAGRCLRCTPAWIYYGALSQRIARELGIHIRTSYRWCWWLRNAALSYEMERQLVGTVEADDLYHAAGNKGQAKQTELILQAA